MAFLFQRGKKRTWWIKYYVHGKQVYHSLGTTNARAAERIRRQIEGEEARGDLIAPSRTPLPAFLEQFCQFLKTVRTRKSFKNDYSVLRVFFGPICPALKLGTRVNQRWRSDEPRPVPDTKAALHVSVQFLEDVSGAMIEAFITRRISEDGIAPKTANRCREVLHRLFNYAAKNCNYVSPDRRHPNPAAMVQRRREPPPTIRFLTAEQIVEQLARLKDAATIHALVATFIYAGLRREEALWLTHDDVDLEKRLIFVRAKTIDSEFWQPKTKRNRTVPISESLHEVLSSYRTSHRSRWFFPSTQGRRWDPDNFSQDLRARNAMHSLAWGCLDYRHTFGSHLAQKGVSLYKIAELMGNSPDICRRHYAALVPEKMHDVVEFSLPVALSPTDGLLQQVLAKLERLEKGEKAPLRLAQ